MKRLFRDLVGALVTLSVIAVGTALGMRLYYGPRQQSAASSS